MGFKNHSQPETDDAFQAWILSLFNWEIDAICDPKRHNSPRVSNPLDKEKPLPDWQPQDGNFSRSARALHIDSEGILRAECQMLDGEYQFSNLSLKSIIMGLNGEFHWLDGTVRSPSCPISNSSDWHFVSGCKVEADRLPPELNGFWVLAECMDDGGEYHIYYLTLDDAISNDNGRLKLITPLGLLTIPLFTDYHVSTVAIAMVIGIQHRRPTVQIEDIEVQVQNSLRSQCFAQTSKWPLAESLDAKAATLISLMWIRFCRKYTVCDLINYRDICKAIDDRLRDQPPPSHELKVLLEHYREMPSHLKRQAFALGQSANNTRNILHVHEALHTLQMLLEVIAEDDEWKPFFRQELCQMIWFRYNATSNRDDLQTACALAETFCTTHCRDGNRKASALIMLANCKWEEDRLSSEQKNRKAIVDALKEAESCSTGLQQHVARQNLCYYHIENMATFETFDHAELYRNLELLDVAPTDIAAEGEEVPPLVEIERWRYKAEGLSLAFQANPEDLSLINKAIECAERSCSAFKTARAKYALSDEIFASSLTAHALALVHRSRTADGSDQKRIIEMYQKALIECRSLSKGRAEILHGLAFHQLMWHEQIVAAEIVGEDGHKLLIDAFENAKAAYRSPWKYSDAYGLYAHTFIRAWELRYGASEDWSFLDEAIQIAEDSHTELLHKNFAKNFACTDLETIKCRLLFRRYFLRRSPGSYDEAMDAARRHCQREDLKAIDAKQVFEIMCFAMGAFERKAEMLQVLPFEDVALVTQQCDQILNLDCAHDRDRIEAGKILGALWVASKEWVRAVRMIELQELKALDVVKNLDRLYGNSRLSMANPLQVANAGQELGEILKWLWDKAVKPILSELGYYPKSKRRHSNQLPRLWWCASDIMSKLPFHAAGEGAESVNSENVYDYAVCSVTVSLTALRMARGFTAPSEKILNDGMLAVSMPTTPDRKWKPLKAEEELRSIKDAAGIIPTCLTNPRKVDVIKRLSEHGIIHFICHGTSEAEDPSSSALILGHQEASVAERLTVRELGNIGFGKARIAYLSACSTAENSSYKLSDESIHLASAFQLAGFPHVIAAFWEAKDQAAIPLAGLFYQNLAGAVTELNTFESNHDVVAYAFHNALCKVRQNKRSRNPLWWAPFVHIGA